MKFREIHSNYKMMVLSVFRLYTLWLDVLQKAVMQQYIKNDVGNGLTCHKTLSLYRGIRAPDLCEDGSRIDLTQGLRFPSLYNFYNKNNVLVKYLQKYLSISHKSPD